MLVTTRSSGPAIAGLEPASASLLRSGGGDGGGGSGAGSAAAPSRGRSHTISTARELSTTFQQQLSSCASGPFLCNAIVAADHRFVVKTNSSLRLSPTPFEVFTAAGKPIFEAPGKVGFAKTKWMELMFNPGMSGVYFTPGVGGFAEGDRRVAYLETKKRGKLYTVYGYKPAFKEQKVSKTVKDVGDRYLWAKIHASAKRGLRVDLIQVRRAHSLV
jgi:hypothetical protein